MCSHLGIGSFQKSSGNLRSLGWALMQYSWGPYKGEFGDRQDSGRMPCGCGDSHGEARGGAGGFCTALRNEHGVSPGQTCCPRTVRSWCALVQQPQETPQRLGSIGLPVTEHDHPPIARKHPQSASRKVWPALLCYGKGGRNSVTPFSTTCLS